MKQFEFRLQKTMEWRERCAEKERLELERLHAEQERLRQSRADVEAGIRTAATPPAESLIPAEELRQMAVFRESLRQLDRHLRAGEDRCRLQIAAQREECLHADRNHQMLVHLHDQRRKEWLADWDKELEQTATDSWNGRRIREMRRQP